jgi:glycosyltransferase involved in cell wall biosynthesis
MKITILSTTYPLRGGIAHFNGLLYKTLIKEHQVDVITFKRQYPSLLFPGKSQLEGGDTTEKIPSRVLVDSINPFNWIKIGLQLKNDKPDLIIFKYWMPFFAPCFASILKFAKLNKHTKAMVICDNVIPHEKRPGDIFLTKWYFNKVDYFVAMSKAVLDDLHKLKPKANSILSFHPVYSNFGEIIPKETAKKHLGITTNKVFLFFGFIREYKGLDTLIEAVNLIKDMPDFTLIVAGEFYTDKQKYLDLIAKYNLEDKIKLYTDFIPTDDVKYYFCASDVVVLPYKDATQSGIIQIANNFNKPIIATKVGGLGEVIKDGFNGYLREPNNPKAIADAILQFYKENKEIEFSENIKAEKNKYSWENFTKQMLDMLKP